MKKMVVRAVVLLLILAAAGAVVWFGFLNGHDENENELVLYGNVDIRQVELAFNASERIVQIMVREGEAVKKGQLLAVLETDRLQLDVQRAEARVAAQKDQIVKLEAGSRAEEIRQARAELEAARSEAEDLERTFQRLRPLAEKNLIAPEQIDQARTRAEAAQAEQQAALQVVKLALAGPRKEDISAAKSQLKALEAESAIARKNLADTELRAPSDGVIQNRILESGDMAFPQKTVFTLALTDPVWVRTYVPEPDLGKLAPGMIAQVVTDSFPAETYPAWIGYISPTAEFTPKAVETPDLRTRLVYQIRVYVCNPRNELRLGMPATVIIPLDQRRKTDEGAMMPSCEAQ